MFQIEREKKRRIKNHKKCRQKELFLVRIEGLFENKYVIIRPKIEICLLNVVKKYIF